MSFRLLRQTLRSLRLRIAAVTVAGFGWGFLMPVLYDQFSDVIRDLANSGVIPEGLLNFGSGSLFTLPGTITLGVQHPMAIALIGVVAIGASATSISGERARGTLEVLLARPLSRIGVYWSTLLAILIAMTVVLVAILAGMLVGALVVGLAEEVEAARMPLVLLNGFGLWAGFATFGMAASVTFDRPAPALGLTLAWLLVHYFLEVLGSLWTDAAWTQEYSLLHHFNPGEILEGALDPIDLAIVFTTAIIPVVYALYLFPQRDLPAPS